MRWESALRASLILLLVLMALGAAYYFFVYRSRPLVSSETAYVVPDSLSVFDTPAEIRAVIATLKQGDRVEVVSHSRNWARVRFSDHRTGYVELRNLMDAETHQAGDKLVDETQQIPAQAAGHAGKEANLRLTPSRDAIGICQLAANQPVEIFERRLVDRTPAPGSANARVREAWYLVRAGSRAGWILGRLVNLDIPPAIAPYAHELNMVAWVVLDAVEDNGRQVPQYVVADRVGSEESDFTHIRVLTWWKKKQAYAVAYVESELKGYLPIRASQLAGRPIFRLRLVDDGGNKFQKVYSLNDTITRPLGTVDGWESEAMPLQPEPRSKRRRGIGVKARYTPSAPGAF
jgi:hypothetical protein